MNKVDTTNWAAFSVLGALLLFLLAAPTDLMAQEKQMQIQADDIGQGQVVTVETGFARTIQDASALFKTANGGTCPIGTINGTLDTATSPTQMGRINRNGVPSTCGGKAFPGLFNAGVTYLYEVHGPYANTGTGTCAEVVWDDGDCDTSAHPSAYATSYDPGNIGMNYVGDIGSSVSGTFEFPLPDGEDYFIIVQETGTPFVVGSCSYSFEINNVPCDLEADLAVTKEIEYNEGTLTGSYHITVTNNGPADAENVVGVDDLPGAIIVNSWSTSQGSFDPFSGIWDIGDMADGASVGLWIYFTLTEQGRYTNTITVSSDQDDPDEDNNEASVSVVLLGDRVVPDFVPGQGAGGTINRGDRFTADLTLDKVVDNETPAVGEDVTWTITVANLGPQSTAKVQVTDTPDACLAPVSADPSRGTFDTSTFVWDIGKIKVGEAVTLDIVTTVTADCSGEVVNYAEVTQSSLPDPDDQFDIFDQAPVEDEKDSASINVSGRQLELDGTTFALGNNYPNPFNPMTLIPFSVAEASHVSIKVYDLLGRTVATLVDGTMAAGVHEVSFDATNQPTGMYLVRMEAAGIVKTMRITLMK